MSEFGWCKCDNPGCEERLQCDEDGDMGLEDLREEHGWMTLRQYGAADGDGEREEEGCPDKFLDFCTVACLHEWSKLEAWLA